MDRKTIQWIRNIQTDKKRGKKIKRYKEWTERHNTMLWWVKNIRADKEEEDTKKEETDRKTI